MNHRHIKHHLVVTALLCLLFQPAWGDDPDDSTQVVQEYYRLLNLANDGDTGSKVSLFLHTAKHSQELEKYAETALKHLVDASNDGHGDASYWIGYLAENGFWMEQSDQGAMIYYVLSAQQGSDKGMAQCVLLFSKAAEEAEKEEERGNALKNAQKWFDELAEIRESSPEYFEAARFNFAKARMYLDITDAYGIELMGDAALDGDKSAIRLLRNLYAGAISGKFDGNSYAAEFAERIRPVIDVVGQNETADE